MPRLQVDALLFDMDGTLVDERLSYRETIRLTAEHLLREIVTPEEVEQVKLVPGLNNDWDATWTLVGLRLGNSRPILPTDADRASHAYRRLQHVFQTYYLGDVLWTELSGVEAPFTWAAPLMERETLLVDLDILRRLAPLALGIATSRPRPEALMALRRHGLEPFVPAAAVVAAEDAPAEKPDPAPLLMLAERLGCIRPIYVGDTVNDALAAAAAGMPFIAVGPGGRELDDAAHAVLESVNEILTVCCPLAAEVPTRA